MLWFAHVGDFQKLRCKDKPQSFMLKQQWNFSIEVQTCNPVICCLMGRGFIFWPVPKFQKCPKKVLLLVFTVAPTTWQRQTGLQALNFPSAYVPLLKHCITEAGEGGNDVRAFTVNLKVPPPFDGNHICISHKLPLLLGSSPSEQTIFHLLLLKGCWCAGKKIRALLIYPSVPLSSTSHLKVMSSLFFL